MIAYRKTNGRAHDLRCVSDDYKAAEGEITLPGWELPDIETLHDPLTPEQQAKEQALARIRELEASITPRRLREAIRGSGKAWLDSVDDQIAAERAKLP